MPKFTIESTFDLPVFRHTTYDAPDAATAFALALADDQWDASKQDYDSCGETRLTGAWEGEDTAYSGTAVELPPAPPARVTVATYEHRHGRDVRVFAKLADAWVWHQQIAAENWEVKLLGASMPDDPEGAADKYFDLVNDEYFNTDECEVQQQEST
jgi:hypothetical protein